MWGCISHLYSNNLPLKCESLSHGSLPFERKPFLSTSIACGALELNCGCPNPPSHCCQHALVSCIATMPVRPNTWPSCMDSFARKTFDTMDPYVHGSTAIILLVWIGHHVEPPILIPIIVRLRGINIGETTPMGHEPTT